jgi:hypothetical protein
MSAGPLVVTYPLTGRSRAIVAEELSGAAEAIYLVDLAPADRAGALGRRKSGSHETRRWRGVDSNFWFRARSEYGRGWRLAALPGRIALRPHVGLAIAARPLQANYKHPIGREERILMKLISMRALTVRQIGFLP